MFRPLLKGLSCSKFPSMPHLGPMILGTMRMCIARVGPKDVDVDKFDLVHEHLRCAQAEGHKDTTRPNRFMVQF